MSIYVSQGSNKDVLLLEDIKNLTLKTLFKIGTDCKKILLIPPDHTRKLSGAGFITDIIYDFYKDKAHVDIIPALGTHEPMSEEEIHSMFGYNIPLSCFKHHDWRNDVINKGMISNEFILNVSSGKVDFSISVDFNKILFEGYDQIISIGQVLPHEVAGMANYTKNIFVGLGGEDSINKSHYLGAVCGIEKILGKTENPIRTVFNYAVSTCLSKLPIHYILTCVGKDERTNKTVMRGFFSGNEEKVFSDAAKLSREINIKFLKKPIKKAVIYLPSEEFKTTWLGNKAVYRTRLAMEDNGELLIIAPGLKGFGEDLQIDKLIRKYGYLGREKILDLVKKNIDLQTNLSAAAHLIHGSSDGRFKIRYAPGSLKREEIESVNFLYADLREAIERYKPETLLEGYHTSNDCEEFYFINNPASGLWALKE